MKIKDLIKALSVIDQDREVVLASDEEGNAYTKLRYVEGETDGGKFVVLFPGHDFVEDEDLFLETDSAILAKYLK